MDELALLGCVSGVGEVGVGERLSEASGTYLFVVDWPLPATSWTCSLFGFSSAMVSDGLSGGGQLKEQQKVSDRRQVRVSCIIYLHT